MGESHKSGDQDDNWLDGRAITCQSCQAPLWRVIRSPFYDEWLFYCDRCPRRAEVSYYDSEVKAIHDRFIAMGDKQFQSERMHREIERRLAPCDCGGQFRLLADRRCHKCHAVVVAGDEGAIDVWPDWPGSDLEHPTPEQEQEWREFEAAFVKKDANLWQREP
jgi:hypothetical protein